MCCPMLPTSQQIYDIVWNYIRVVCLSCTDLCEIGRRVYIHDHQSRAPVNIYSDITRFWKYRYFEIFSVYRIVEARIKGGNNNVSTIASSITLCIYIYAVKGSNDIHKKFQNLLLLLLFQMRSSLFMCENIDGSSSNKKYGAVKPQNLTFISHELDLICSHWNILTAHVNESNHICIKMLMCDFNFSLVLIWTSTNIHKWFDSLKYELTYT